MGAAGFIGLAFLAAAAEGVLHGAEALTPLYMGFGGLGFCTLALGLWLRGFADTGL